MLRGRDHNVDHRGSADERSPNRGRPFGWGLVVGVAAGSIVAVAAALLVAQNGQRVRFEWLTFDFRAPLWLALTASLAAGAVIVELVNLFVRLRRSRRIR